MKYYTKMIQLLEEYNKYNTKKIQLLKGQVENCLSTMELKFDRIELDSLVMLIDKEAQILRDEIIAKLGHALLDDSEFNFNSEVDFDAFASFGLLTIGAYADELPESASGKE